jgi:hypothetical protein
MIATAMMIDLPKCSDGMAANRWRCHEHRAACRRTAEQPLTSTKPTRAACEGRERIEHDHHRTADVTMRMRRR